MTRYNFKIIEKKWQNYWEKNNSFASTIKNAYRQNFSLFFTDDASVLESNGGKIISIIGEEHNIKITTKEDLKIAEFFMQ